MQVVFGKFKSRLHPIFTYGLAGFSGYCFLQVSSDFYGKIQAENEIQYRKKQLSTPIYELGQGELGALPWNETNIHHWLYRPIKITGRLIHLRQVNITKTVNGQVGVYNITPMVTHEDQNGQNQCGVGIARGWLPHSQQWLDNRQAIESSDVKYEYVGYLSKLDDMSQRPGLSRGNKKYDSDRKSNNVYSHANLYDMADTFEFKNKGQARLGVIQSLDTETSLLDERDHRHYSQQDALMSQPMRKTYAGALQLGRMPWDYRTSMMTHGLLGTAGLAGLVMTLL